MLEYKEQEIVSGVVSDPEIMRLATRRWRRSWTIARCEKKAGSPN